MRPRPAILLVVLLLALPVGAHKASDGYLTIEHRNATLDVRVDLALRDLENAIGLDSDGDGVITWRELRSRHADIAAYVTRGLAISSAGERCVLTPVAHEVDRHTDGAYAVLRLSGRCTADSPALSINYRLLFDVDGTHRGLVRYVAADGGTKSIVLTGDASSTSP